MEKRGRKRETKKQKNTKENREEQKRNRMSKKEISFFTVKINELTVIKDYFTGFADCI